jgi:hypothetical protein
METIDNEKITDNKNSEQIEIGRMPGQTCKTLKVNCLFPLEKVVKHDAQKRGAGFPHSDDASS